MTWFTWNSALVSLACMSLNLCVYADDFLPQRECWWYHQIRNLLNVTLPRPSWSSSDTAFCASSSVRGSPSCLCSVDSSFVEISPFCSVSILHAHKERESER